jgi:hypothetical protein
MVGETLCFETQPNRFNNNNNNNRNVKSEVIPIIIGLNGTISKSLRQYLGNVPGKQIIKEVQNTAILGTAHTAESADVKVQNIQHGK